VGGKSFLILIAFLPLLSPLSSINIFEIIVEYMNHGRTFLFAISDLLGEFARILNAPAV
jgi:hypothetical protein